MRSNHVFFNREGNRIDAANLLRAFYIAVEKAGIAKARFHDLRHTFATRLVQAGVAEGEDMRAAVMDAEAGITLLGLDGHIMIYLGKSRGVPFAINQIAGYWGRRGYMRLNRAAVAGLNAGAGAPAGALLKRIKAVTEVLVPAYGAAEVSVSTDN